MKTTKTLISILAVGAALGATAPAFADTWHGRGPEHHDSYRDRHDYRGPERYVYRDNYRRSPIVIERPYVVQRAYVVQPPVYYAPQPMSYGYGPGPAALIGQAIGTFIDER